VQKLVHSITSAAIGLGLVLAYTPAASALTPAASSAAAARPNHPQLDIQDSSVNFCDNSEQPIPRVPATTLAYQSAQADYEGVLSNAPSTARGQSARFSPMWDVALGFAIPGNGRRTHPAESPQAVQVVQQEELCLAAWLRYDYLHGVSPEIAFKPDYNYIGHDGKTAVVLVPTIQEYNTAMAAFNAIYRFGCDRTSCAEPKWAGIDSRWLIGYPHGRIAKVEIIAPWNEPDFDSKTKVGIRGQQHPQQFYLAASSKQGVKYVFGAPNGSEISCPAHPDAENCGPILAAEMWLNVRTACPGCTVIAGDFSGGGGTEHEGVDPKHRTRATYLSLYATYLKDHHAKTTVWAVHPYGDVWGYEYWAAKAALDKPGSKAYRNDMKHARKAGTTTRFTDALRKLGYGGDQLWLNEINSTYARSCADSNLLGQLCAAYLGRHKLCGPDLARQTAACVTLPVPCTTEPGALCRTMVFGDTLQSEAARFLLYTVTQIGRPLHPGATRPYPRITRLYWLRLVDCGPGTGTGPAQSLILEPCTAGQPNWNSPFTLVRPTYHTLTTYLG
jgi:hypothetical protein